MTSSERFPSLVFTRLSSSTAIVAAGCSKSLSILFTRRWVRIEELGLYPAGGWTATAERLSKALALVLAYALFLTAAALARSAFFVGRPAAALVAIAAGAVALWLVLEGESALDAQALDEFEGQ